VQYPDGESSSVCKERKRLIKNRNGGIGSRPAETFSTLEVGLEIADLHQTMEVNGSSACT
jgi:hypothetical protein